MNLSIQVACCFNERFSVSLICRSIETPSGRGREMLNRIGQAVKAGRSALREAEKRIPPDVRRQLERTVKDGQVRFDKAVKDVRTRVTKAAGQADLDRARKRLEDLSKQVQGMVQAFAQRSRGAATTSTALRTATRKPATTRRAAPRKAAPRKAAPRKATTPRHNGVMMSVAPGMAADHATCPTNGSLGPLGSPWEAASHCTLSPELNTSAI